MTEYTVKCMQALRWFAEREPIGWFDKTAPSNAMRTSLERRGLIQRVGPLRAVGLIKYEVTPRGHAVLEARP